MAKRPTSFLLDYTSFSRVLWLLQILTQAAQLNQEIGGSSVLCNCYLAGQQRQAGDDEQGFSQERGLCGRYYSTVCHKTALRIVSLLRPVSEVHVEPTQTIYVRKHKPHRHHLHKTVYVGGYAGVGGDVAVPETKTVVYKTVQPIEKRIDVDVAAHGGAGASVNAEHYGPVSGVTYNKEVVVNAKPSTFFQDIFNIPISTLKAVSGFLTNTAENTGISVQKSASFKTDSDITSKHVSPPSSSSSASEAHISVQTPNASKLIDDIFSIPINTLSAVNKFLENNVAGRKRVQVTTEVDGEPTRIRLGPHARRRANKQVVIVQEPAEQKPQESN